MSEASLGTAYVQIRPKADGIAGAISETLGGEAESAGTSAGTKIGAFAKKALAKVAIGAAVIKTVKGALDEGAKLQQSYLGGLDTLYGSAADGARKYAREAAKYGVSMNDYAEQAVSFGAALKSAYGGDTQKAMEAANKAIEDMADNAAKMGTPLESVQQAYQGFAKGQYMLLDNLKLGYGGTKTEMERLLADAQKLTGVKYDINNLGDVYDAIHVIQGELGLTGVAAAEASETLSGSFGAMKAAAQNLLGSLALGQGVKPAMQNLVKTTSTFLFENLIPMIGKVIKSLPAAVGTFLQTGLPLFISSIQTLLNSIGAWFTGFANSLTGAKVKQWISSTLPKIVVAGAQLIGKLASALLTNLPKVVAAIGKIGAAIVKGLGSAIWGKVTSAANGIKDRFLKPINSLKDKVSGVVSKIKKIFPVSLGKILNFSLPTISVSGGKAPWGIGGKGVAPSIRVEWYRKAYDNAVMFSDPTVLATGSGFKGFGDGNGSEIVMGKDYMLGMIQEAVSGSSLARNMAAVGQILEAFLPMIANKEFVLSGQDFVYANKQGINSALGNEAILTARGVR